MATKASLKATVAQNRSKKGRRLFADGGAVDSDTGVQDMILAQQRQQQENVLPTERQPPLVGQTQPQSEALEHPAISPEDVIAGGLGNMAAEAITPAITGAARAVGEAAVPFAKRLATEEAGEVPLTKQSAQAWANLAKPPEATPAAQVPIYSKLEQVANDKIRQQMPAEYAKATLKNAGVTQEEMDVYGVNDFLDSHPNVTPDEFKAHLEANRPDIQKHVYGSNPGAANGPYNARNLPEEYEPSDHDIEAAAEDDKDTFYERLSDVSDESLVDDPESPHRTFSIDSIQEDENGEPLEEPKYQVDFGHNGYRVGYGANRRTLSGLEEFDSEEKAQEAIDAAQEQWEESAREYHDDLNYNQVWDEHLDYTRDRLRKEAAEKLNQEPPTPPAPDAIPQEPIEGKPSYANYKLKGGSNYREELYTGPSKTALGQARNEQAFRAALDKTNWPESIGGKETAAPEMAQYIDQLRNSTKPEDKAAVAAYDKVVPQWVNSARAQMFANQKRIAELSEKFKEGADDTITLNEIHQLRDKNSDLAKTIAAKNPNYKGGHFGDTQPNIWAHARTTDRTTDDGLNSLHVEEVQSDPHQEARELGYQGANPKPYSGPTFTQADADAHVQKMRGELQQYMKEKGLTDEPEALAQAQRDNLFKPEDLDKLEAISKYKAHQANPSGVPELIMSKSWDKNVFKRLLKRAVDQDKDALTWNTGEISASNNGTPKEKMGGQKLNYDVKYPAIIKKLVNEFDPSIKVEKMGLPDSDAPVWGIKLTPKLKQGLRSKGLPSFAEGGEIWDEANAASQAIKSGQQPPTDHPATTAAAMNVAAGSIAPPEGYGLNNPGLMQTAGDRIGMKVPSNLEEAQSFARAADKAHQNGMLTPDHVKAAWSAVRRFMGRSYADGGEVADAPTDGVNVMSPEGEYGSLSHEELPGALQAGYRLATPEENDNYAKQQEFGTPVEQAKTAAEGVSQGVLGPAAPWLEEKLDISTPERMRARQEVNPGTYYGGQFAGLAGGAFTGVGEGAAVEGLGKMAVGGLNPTTTMGHIGSAAARAAVENMIIQGSDEASKMVISPDPQMTSQAAQTALVNMGLSGLIGAGFGATLGTAKPIWDAAAQSKIGQMLHVIAAKTGGIEGVAPDEIKRAISVSGLDVPPEVVAAMSKDPEIQHMFGSLMESSTQSGLSAQESLRLFRQRAANAVVGAMGSTPEDVAGLGDLSAYDAGADLKKALKTEIKSGIDPIAEEFEAIKKKFSGMIMPDNVKPEMSTALGQIHADSGLHLDPSGPQAKLVQRAIDMVGNMKTLEDVRNAASIIDDVTKDPQLWRIGGQIKRVFRDTEDRVLDQQLAKASGPRLNLRGDDYSIFTAENPGSVPQTPEENASRMKQLYSELDAKGIPYHQTTGRIGANPKSGVLIPHSPAVSKDTINEIAQKYGQESVLHRMGGENQLEYITGPNAGKYHLGHGIDLNPDDLADYTQVGNKKFHANLDMEHLKVPELVHYSAHEQPLSILDPQFHGTGAASREMARRPEQLPKTYYYESHAIPEDTVIGRAKRVYHVARPNNILDLNSDAGKAIAEEAGKTATNQTDALNAMEKLIQAKGYAGYKNTASQLPGAVALFGEQPVLRGRPLDAHEFSEIRQREEAKALQEKLREHGGKRAGDLVNDQLKAAAIGEPGEEDEQIKARHRAARLAYGKAMTTIDALNDRLHVGKYYGPGTFLSALGDMQPEDVLRRLSPKNDAGIIGELQQKFPNTAEALRKYHIDQTLKAAADKAKGEDPISLTHFYNAVGKMSPEMRQFVIPQDAGEKLNAIQRLIESIPAKMNTSGTAKTLDSLWGHIPASAVGMAVMMTEHSPMAGFLVGGITKALGRDIPDAARLGLLKFLGSNAPVSSQGFKSMVDFIDNAVKGENLLNRGVQNVFRTGVEVLPASQMPSENQRVRLDKQLMRYQENPSGLLNIATGVGHYMPNHSIALGQTAATAVNYLNSQRPGISVSNPLDTPIKPNSIQKTQYNRALDIAEQPLVILSKIKKGTMTTQDVLTMKQLYPDLYQRVSQKLTSEVMSVAAKGKPIPYALRLQLSTFLGQPLDSTLTPQAILNAQASSFKRQAAAPQGAPNKGATSKLGGIAKGAQTRSQSREAARAGQQKD